MAIQSNGSLKLEERKLINADSSFESLALEILIENQIE